MKKRLSLMIVAMCVGLGSTGVSAADGLEKAVGARQSLMRIYAFNLGQLGAMAKGQMDYNADAAKAAADNLLAAASMKNGAMWPQGSDSAALAGKTRAKPEIWSTYPKVAEKGKALVMAAQKLAAAAGSGVDGIRGNIGGVGEACKGCHKPFRVPKQ